MRTHFKWTSDSEAVLSALVEEVGQDWTYIGAKITVLFDGLVTPESVRAKYKRLTEEGTTTKAPSALSLTGIPAVFSGPPHRWIMKAKEQEERNESWGFAELVIHRQEDGEYTGPSAETLDNSWLGHIDAMLEAGKCTEKQAVRARLQPRPDWVASYYQPLVIWRPDNTPITT